MGTLSLWLWKKWPEIGEKEYKLTVPDHIGNFDDLKKWILQQTTELPWKLNNIIGPAVVKSSSLHFDLVKAVGAPPVNATEVRNKFLVLVDWYQANKGQFTDFCRDVGPFMSVINELEVFNCSLISIDNEYNCTPIPSRPVPILPADIAVLRLFLFVNQDMINKAKSLIDPATVLIEYIRWFHDSLPNTNNLGAGPCEISGNVYSALPTNPKTPLAAMVFIVEHPECCYITNKESEGKFEFIGLPSNTNVTLEAIVFPKWESNLGTFLLADASGFLRSRTETFTVKSRTSNVKFQIPSNLIKDIISEILGMTANLQTYGIVQSTVIKEQGGDSGVEGVTVVLNKCGDPTYVHPSFLGPIYFDSLAKSLSPLSPVYNILVKGLGGNPDLTPVPNRSIKKTSYDGGVIFIDVPPGDYILTAYKEPSFIYHEAHVRVAPQIFTNAAPGYGLYCINSNSSSQGGQTGISLPGDVFTMDLLSQGGWNSFTNFDFIPTTDVENGYETITKSYNYWLDIATDGAPFIKSIYIKITDGPQELVGKMIIASKDTDQRIVGKTRYSIDVNRAGIKAYNRGKAGSTISKALCYDLCIIDLGGVEQILKSYKFNVIKSTDDNTLITIPNALDFYAACSLGALSISKPSSQFYDPAISALYLGFDGINNQVFAGGKKGMTSIIRLPASRMSHIYYDGYWNIKADTKKHMVDSLRFRI